MNRTEFRRELQNLINRYSMENGSDTPDFILADYLMDSLDAFNTSCNRRSLLVQWCNKPEKEDV